MDGKVCGISGLGLVSGPSCENMGCKRTKVEAVKETSWQHGRKLQNRKTGKSKRSQKKHRKRTNESEAGRTAMRRRWTDYTVLSIQRHWQRSSDQSHITKISLDDDITDCPGYVSAQSFLPQMTIWRKHTCRNDSMCPSRIGDCREVNCKATIQREKKRSPSQ